MDANFEAKAARRRGAALPEEIVKYQSLMRASPRFEVTEASDADGLRRENERVLHELSAYRLSLKMTVRAGRDLSDSIKKEADFIGDLLKFRRDELDDRIEESLRVSLVQCAQSEAIVEEQIKVCLSSLDTVTTAILAVKEAVSEQDAAAASKLLSALGRGGTAASSD